MRVFIHGNFVVINATFNNLQLIDKQLFSNTVLIYFSYNTPGKCTNRCRVFGGTTDGLK
jgi:hypothetical protein